MSRLMAWIRRVWSANVTVETMGGKSQVVGAVVVLYKGGGCDVDMADGFVLAPSQLHALIAFMKMGMESGMRWQVEAFEAARAKAEAIGRKAVTGPWVN